MEKHVEDLSGRDQLPLTTGPSIPPRRRNFPRLAGFLGIVACLWLTFHWLPIALPNFKISLCHNHARTAEDGFPFEDQDALTDSATADPQRIPLEAHIMSKCPDARDCLRELVVPTMERANDKIDFELSFIAKWVKSSFLRLVIQRTNRSNY